MGGESPQHKALKAYVCDHPGIVGASKESRAIAEHPLPSLDKIDVLFRSAHECIAVEVKSSVSEGVPGDFERGIYQAIKYLALLRAMSLDKKFPSDMRALARLLRVAVIQNVVPSEAYLSRALLELAAEERKLTWNSVRLMAPHG